MPGIPVELVRNSSEYPSMVEHRLLFHSSYSIRKAFGARCVRVLSANLVQNSEQLSKKFPEVLPFLSGSFGAFGGMTKTLDCPWANPPCQKGTKSFDTLYHTVV